MTSHILESPSGLSDRAIAFLKAKGRRTPFDPGLTGGRLSDEILRVYGQPRDEIVELCRQLQARYGGLTYESVYFDGDIRFAPVCEPEDPDEELEILYAVETGNSTGASVKATGHVEVGFDGAGVLEFASLDSLIESDAMVMTATRFANTGHRFVDAPIDSIREILLGDGNLELNYVSIAGGSHSWWLESESLTIFCIGTWASLNLGMPPLLRVWARSVDDMKRIDEALTES